MLFLVNISQIIVLNFTLQGKFVYVYIDSLWRSVEWYIFKFNNRYVSNRRVGRLYIKKVNLDD